jgi:hypothetical protein
VSVFKKLFGRGPEAQGDCEPLDLAAFSEGSVAALR